MFLKLRLLALGAVLTFQCVALSAEAPSQPPENVSSILQKLKNECDNPSISNESEWISYRSATERKRMGYIAALKSVDAVAETRVRQELVTAKGEYRQMLVVTLATFGDNTSIWQTGRLMLKAKLPAVRVCAALGLRPLKDKRLMEPFKQALADPFERRDGGCVMPGMIFPVRLIASDALVGLGVSLPEVRRIERDHLIVKLKAEFQNRADVQATWQNLLSDMGKGKSVFSYNGQQVLLRGTALSQRNPMQVKIAHSQATCLVFLRETEANSLSLCGDEDCGVEIRGVVRSTDADKKQIEVWSMQSTITSGH